MDINEELTRINSEVIRLHRNLRRIKIDEDRVIACLLETDVQIEKDFFQQALKRFNSDGRKLRNRLNFLQARERLLKRKLDTRLADAVFEYLTN